MAFPPRNRSDRNGPRRSPQNDRRPNNSGSSGSRPVSLSSRFSSMAAERISSTASPSFRSTSISSRGGVQKSRNPRRRNDRGMEVDQVGSPSNGRRNNRNRNDGSNSNNNRNNKNSRKPNSRTPVKKTPLNQTDLDKELEAYMMKNESTARNTLDMELDSYMSSAPTKTN